MPRAPQTRRSHQNEKFVPTPARQATRRAHPEKASTARQPDIYPLTHGPRCAHTHTQHSTTLGGGGGGGAENNRRRVFHTRAYRLCNPHHNWELGSSGFSRSKEKNILLPGLHRFLARVWSKTCRRNDELRIHTGLEGFSETRSWERLRIRINSDKYFSNLFEISPLRMPIINKNRIVVIKNSV